MATEAPPLAVVVKGWPRLSETFIAQELEALEARGLRFEIWSLRHPTDTRRHPAHEAVTAPARYLPEYLLHEPLRVLHGLLLATRRRGFPLALSTWWRDLRRDPSWNRIRRFGQACVLAAELPETTRFLYVHFLHTPGSVTRYAAQMRGLGWGFSAHARDIWTTPDWEKAEKMADARFGVTCTAVGAEHLKALAPEPGRIRLLYHGLDLTRFPPPPKAREPRTGADPEQPVQILSVGRLVEKKGYGDLLAALADLPRSMRWRFIHIGGGPLGETLKNRAASYGFAHRIQWRGARTQQEVIAAMREADIFVLPSREAGDGDRDGLPNVLMEAASQALPCVATRFSAIPEFVEHGVTGLLVPPGAPGALAEAIRTLALDPERREALGAAARRRLTGQFGAAANADLLAQRLRAELTAAA